MNARIKGYSIVEFLIALFILGALFSLAMLSLKNAGLRAEVRKTQQTLVAAINTAREASRRLSVNTEVKVALQEQGYIILVKDETDQEINLKYSLPSSSIIERMTKSPTGEGLNWKPIADQTTIAYYEPPFGETDASSTLIRVRHRKDPSIFACIRIIGVTGKVVASDACP